MSRLRDLHITGNRRLPAHLLSASYVRSSGPGGQNVNNVATKVDLRLDLPAAERYFDRAEMARLHRRLGNRLDADGRVCVTASEHREQARNLAAAIDRMETLLNQALRVPKRRIGTKPTKGAHERRIQGKKIRGRLKTQRGKGDTGW